MDREIASGDPEVYRILGSFIPPRLHHVVFADSNAHFFYRCETGANPAVADSISTLHSTAMLPTQSSPVKLSLRSGIVQLGYLSPMALQTPQCFERCPFIEVDCLPGKDAGCMVRKPQGKRPFLRGP